MAPSPPAQGARGVGVSQPDPAVWGGVSGSRGGGGLERAACPAAGGRARRGEGRRGGPRGGWMEATGGGAAGAWRVRLDAARARGAEAAEALKAREAALAARARAGLAVGALRAAALERLARERFRDLDANLLRLTLRWYAAAEAAAEVAAQERSSELRQVGQERALGLALLRSKRHATELSWETGGAIRSIQLEASDSQFQRCERAVRQGIAGGVGPVRVVGVRRLENRYLMARFHRATSVAGPEARTLGLFCALPRASTPRVVCFGVGREESMPPAEVLADIFWPKWPPGPGDSAAQPTSNAARDAARAAPPLDLPVSLSPSSEAPLAELHLLRGCHRGGAEAPAPAEGAADPVHHLLLCRVLVSRSIDADCSRAPPAQSPDGCDTVRDPRSGATFVYRAEHVYPEFLVQVIFSGEAPDVDGQPQAISASTTQRARKPITGEGGIEDAAGEDGEWPPTGSGDRGGASAEAEIQLGSIAAELQEAASDVAGLHRAAQAALASGHQRKIERLRCRVAAAERALEEEVGRSEALRREMASYARARRTHAMGGLRNTTL